MSPEKNEPVILLIKIVSQYRLLQRSIIFKEAVKFLITDCESWMVV